MLGISALISGDFVFLPSDTRICKAEPNSSQAITLYMRFRFFLPSLRGIRGTQARHLLYLQLRRSILEHQLPCSFTQLVELDGLALQAEFGDYDDRVCQKKNKQDLFPLNVHPIYNISLLSTFSHYIFISKFASKIEMLEQATNSIRYYS